MSKLYYRNEIGKIYNDKLVIGNKKFPNGTITSIKIVNYIDRRKNFFLFLLSCFCFVSFFFEFSYSWVAIIFGSVLLFLSSQRNYYKNFIEIETSNVDESLSFPLSHKKMLNAKEFLKEAQIYLQSNTISSNNEINVKKWYLKKENHDFFRSTVK